MVSIKNLNKKSNFLMKYLFSLFNKNNDFFNKENYTKKYDDIGENKSNPIIHYILHGIDEKRNDLYDKNVAEFNLVKNSDLFDSNFYSKTYNINLKSNLLIYHYLETGYKKGYNPSEKFNGNNYLKKYPDVTENGWNPLVHYLKYGKYNHRTDFIDKNIKEWELVKDSDLFDFNFYKTEYGLNLENEQDLLLHYLEFGYKKGYNPSEKFNGNNYLKKYPDVKEADLNPLVHYLKYGQDEFRTDIIDKNVKEYELVKNSGLFDYNYYNNNHHLKFQEKQRMLLHYLEFGNEEGYNPSKKFNGKNYLKKYPTVRNGEWNPLVHYLKYGKSEGKTDVINENVKTFELVYDSDLFDVDYYFENYGQSLKNKTELIIHYLEIGYKKGYNPSENFNGNNYLEKYLDVKKAGWNPLAHYLKYGQYESRTDIFNKNKKYYELIKKSDLFDYDYYETKYNRTFESEEEALMHYLDIGYKYGFNPSERFDGNVYLAQNPDVKQSGLNPLIHYLNDGISEGRFFSKKKSLNNFMESYTIENIINHLNDEICIIIFESNIQHAESCIENFIKNNDGNYKIILLETDDSIDYFNRFENVETRILDENFIKEFNSEIKRKYDVIFIKDNIITFDKFLSKLKMAAYSKDKIGFVSPISNYSGIPLINEEIQDSNLINNLSRKKYLESPLPNDSCVYIKKDVFERMNIDLLDENWLKKLVTESYEKGWVSALDDSTFVKYEFENKSTLKDKYNLTGLYNFENKVSIDFLNSEAFNEIHNDLNRYFDNQDFINNKKNILYVLHFSGGVEFAVKDIGTSVIEEYNCYILKSFKNKLILHVLHNGILIPIEKFELKNVWHTKMIQNKEFMQIYFYILVNYNIKLIEIDHLLFHSFDLPIIANILNIPLVLALHDYYFICPTFVLLDENNKYCGGHCENESKNCNVRLTWFDLPIDIVNWKKEWQNVVKELLFDKCSSIITATEFTKNMFVEHYPYLSNKITIIEHGRDLIKYDNFSTVPSIHLPIKILIPGTLSIHKGSEFIKELKKLDVDNKLEFHFIGMVDEEIMQLGKYHGPYNRLDFAKYVSKIKPSFIGIFSIWPETYSYTLTESISTGVPVIVSNLGAQESRVKEHGGGWIIDINNPKKAYNMILNISKNKKEYKKVKNEMKNIPQVSFEDMGNKYKELYGKLLK